MADFMETLFGSPGKQGSTYGGNQLSLIDQIIQQIKGMGNQDIQQNQGYQQGQEWLNSLFNDQDFFNRFEAPAQRNFQENVIPDLANRFASQGSGGSLGSTGFRNQLGREGSRLSEGLAAQRGNMQQQGIGQQLGYSQQPIQNMFQMLQQALQPTQNTYQPATGGLFGPALGAAIGGLSQGYGQALGGRFAGQSPLTG